MNKKSIGKNIQALRIECGMTQVELAEKAGVSTDHISHIEIGSGSISLPLLLEICRLLNTTPNDILLGECSATHPTGHSDDFGEESLENISVNDGMNPDDIRLLNLMHQFISRKKQNIQGYSGDSM